MQSSAGGGIILKQQRELVAYPLKYKDLGQVKLPKIRYRKGAKLTKNPYKIKKIPFIDDSKRPKRILDGYAILDEAKCEFPNDVIKIKLSKKNMVQTKVEDLGWFIYLVDLDISENELFLEDFIYLSGLQTLNISANKIDTVKLTENHTFKNLEILDLSFNHLSIDSITSLAFIPQLKKLSLECNDLRALPETMSNFQNLEEFNLSGNLFESDQNASNLWFTLASIKKLKKLDLSRNILRGIHTERLVAGNFMSLQILDFSYNAVENQHNLICARNFRNLQKLIITGNPFSIKNEHKGLEMEVYARTGAIVVNEEIDKYYLKPKTDKNRFKIKFDNIRRIEQDDFSKQRNYFLGIEMPQPNEIQEQEQKTDEEQEEEQEEQQQEEQQVQGDNQEEQVMFITEDPNIAPAHKKSQKSMEQNQKASQNSQQFQQPQQSIQSQASGSVAKTNSMNYDEFIEAARDQLGDIKEYDQHYDLNTAYKTLKNMIKRPDNFDQRDLDEPNYLKPTATIQRYKFKEQQSQLVTADQMEKYEKRKSSIGNSQDISKLNKNNAQQRQNTEEQKLKTKLSSDEVVKDIARLF
ncbi:hypothetical protein TTHERM_00023940 (macronuclear) [Tetrahymena thermophila SB210]|uniref:Leucine rich repeat protein n=1 Tax=Tetrahymena thermophila (strain SB210) TaxID=312017 RepID=Q22R87_TETTS|nr:hypothetical protein TTHERM_00023940 [Tetrahymena thermophila SB210]EAR88235.1 hypothetical protein TTHERM_00023940 [Tetrahymena thermophila SB210]|eukprot:XP_001008480.1 hypothetical protein TTHERM_00023940 [Tetrahymena thermophila SB210]